MKKITFIPVSDEAENLVDMPKPAKLYLPKWYKDVPKFDNKKIKIFNNGMSNATMKSCMPFIDAFTSGYIQETWCDIYIEQNENEIIWKYSSGPEIISSRQDGTNYFPLNDDFLNIELLWKQQWTAKLPFGYSMLYTHPLNRHDLPFFSLSGVIDNDKYYIESSTVNYPFFIKRGFNGIIPKGTPMFQMIPIKRESWISSSDTFRKYHSTGYRQVRKFFYDGYKKLYWVPKSYK